jgi:hypothetical protein
LPQKLTLFCRDYWQLPFVCRLLLSCCSFTSITGEMDIIHASVGREETSAHRS